MILPHMQIRVNSNKHTELFHPQGTTDLPFNSYTFIKYALFLLLHLDNTKLILQLSITNIQDVVVLAIE